MLYFSTFVGCLLFYLLKHYLNVEEFLDQYSILLIFTVVGFISFVKEIVVDVIHRSKMVRI